MLSPDGKEWNTLQLTAVGFLATNGKRQAGAVCVMTGGGPNCLVFGWRQLADDVALRIQVGLADDE